MAIIADNISADGFSGGSPSTLYVAQAAYASLPAGTVTREKAIATDVGPNGSEMSWNGARWIPVNGRVVIANMDSPHGAAPSGTIGAGSSGNITLGTSLPRTYTEGLYLYLPAIATTPAITAGYYWVVMSSATVGTVYSSKGGAAINFSAGSAFTGVTTAIEAIGATIPAGLMGNNGMGVITISGLCTNSGNAKTGQLWLGSGNINGMSLFTSDGLAFARQAFANRGSASRQTVTPDFSNITVGPISTSIDTSVSQYFGFKIIRGTATEYFIIESAIAEAIVP